MPNEMNISLKGDVHTYFERAMKILFEQKFTHLKVVARGTACNIAIGLMELLYKKNSQIIKITESMT